MDQILFGFLLAIAVAFLAWKKDSLSKSGALAATVVGTIIFGLGGWTWAVVLLTFFITSSLLSNLFSKRKSDLNEKFDKGSKRDAGQVLANSGVAAIFAIIHHFLPDDSWPWVGFIASIAAVNADTWATELGILSSGLPRLITTWKKVEKGTSGAISAAGTLAAITGSSLVALAAILVQPDLDPLKILIITAMAGFLGSLVDSLLGATVQAIYQCPTCNKDTEKHPIHVCGTETILIKGYTWLNNDLVNASCALVGALSALSFIWLLW